MTKRSMHDDDFLRSVYDLQTKGFAGMFTGRVFRCEQARRMEREGLLRSSWMDVCDEDGGFREGCQQRVGYSLTQAGLDRIPETERYAGNVEVDEPASEVTKV